MATTLDLDIRSSFTWLQQDQAALGSWSDSSKLEFLRSLTSELHQLDALWYDQRTLAAAAWEDLELSSLGRSLLGGTVAVEFAQLKALLVLNQSAEVDQNLVLGGAAVRPVTSLFAGEAAAQISLPGQGSLQMVHPGTGWQVSAGVADRLRVHNQSSSSITYAVVLAGTAA